MQDISKITISTQQVNLHNKIKTHEKTALKEKEIVPQDSFSFGDKPELNVSRASKVEFKPEVSKAYNGGYDAKFIDGEEVPLPRLTGPAKEQVLKFGNKGETVRDYTHFSLVMNKDRKLAFYTAHNVDGKNLQGGIRRKGWEVDYKIGHNNQLDNRIYSHNPLDRGHLVRRVAVNWGDRKEAIKANRDTFYYTNAAPQHKDLNQRAWLDLENWLLENADQSDQKLSVFTGPVFRDNDPEYRGEKLPQDFFKVIILKRKSDGKLAAAGFMMSQKDLIRGMKDYKTDLEGEGEDKFDEPKSVPTSAVAPFQIPIEQIERLTNLDFGELKDIDAYSLYRQKQDELYKGVPEGFIIKEKMPARPQHFIHSKEDIII